MPPPSARNVPQDFVERSVDTVRAALLRPRREDRQQRLWALVPLQEKGPARRPGLGRVAATL